MYLKFRDNCRKLWEQISDQFFQTNKVEAEWPIIIWKRLIIFLGEYVLFTQFVSRQLWGFPGNVFGVNRRVTSSNKDNFMQNIHNFSRILYEILMILCNSKLYYANCHVVKLETYEGKKPLSLQILLHLHWTFMEIYGIIYGNCSMYLQIVWQFFDIYLIIKWFQEIWFVSIY